jgi:hypothetical protein
MWKIREEADTIVLTTFEISGYKYEIFWFPHAGEEHSIDERWSPSSEYFNGSKTKIIMLKLLFCYFLEFDYSCRLVCMFGRIG